MLNLFNIVDLLPLIDPAPMKLILPEFALNDVLESPLFIILPFVAIFKVKELLLKFPPEFSVKF